MAVHDNVAARGLMARALGTQPDIFVVASSASGASAIQTAARLPLDAVVVDTEIPGFLKNAVCSPPGVDSFPFGCLRIRPWFAHGR